MANKKISEFTEVTVLGAEHFIPVVNETLFQNEKISKDNFITQTGGLLSISVSLTAAQIKTAFSVPIDSGIPLPSATQAIEVVSGSTKYTFGTVAFDFGMITVFGLKTDTANDYQMNAPTISGLTNSFAKLEEVNATDIQLVVNKKLMITAYTDSATGDGTAIIYILYRIIQI